MKYTVKTLAKLAGVTSKTIRHYDKIGLLKPTHVTDSGYRIYRQAEVDKMQHIMFYKLFGLDLSAIKEILDADDFDDIKALKKHKTDLELELIRIKALIEAVEKTIASKKGEIYMSNVEKFEAFKRPLSSGGKKQSSEETLIKYNDESTAQITNEKPLMDIGVGAPKEIYDQSTLLSAKLQEILDNAVQNGDDSEHSLAKAAQALHKEWLLIIWKGTVKYSPEVHINLIDMYLSDERFIKHYKSREAVEFLRHAVELFAE